MSGFHPKTGVHYAVILPRAVTFDELRASYERAAQDRSWLTVYDSVAGVPDTDRTLALFWGELPVNFVCRAMHVARVYSEPLGPTTAMLPDHRAARQRLLDDLNWYVGAVFLHTPAMAEQMRALVGDRAQVHVLPAGLDPSIMVEPDWRSPKTHDVLFYGSDVGKRIWTVPWLAEMLGNRFHHTVTFGRALGELLNQSRASLYLAHSDVTSFSTWRTWQTLATSAALIVEDGKDAWPLVAGYHYLRLPVITRYNVHVVAEELRRILSYPPALTEIARAARLEILPDFTADKCIDEYLVPAGARICDEGNRGRYGNLMGRGRR